MNNPEIVPTEPPSVYRTGDLVSFLSLKDGDRIISTLPTSLASVIQQTFRLQTEELRQLIEPDSDPSAFCHQMIQQGRRQFIQLQSGLPFLTLAHEDYRQVLTSRNYPLFSVQELDTIRQTRFAFFGLSTGLTPAIGLAQLGAEHIAGVDPDFISLSNLNRITGATIRDIGQPKAHHAGQMLAGINPYIELNLFPHRLNPTETEAVIKSSDIVIEMIDDPPSKMMLRQVAKKFNKPVITGTNTGWQSIISVEQPTDPPFSKSLQPETLAFLSHPSPGPEAYQALIDIVGINHIGLRQMTNLLLHALHPEARYLAQHGPNAAINGGTMVCAIAAVACGRPVDSHTVIPIDSILQTRPDDSALLEELQQHYPEFVPYTSLDQAVADLCQQFFRLTWSVS